MRPHGLLGRSILASVLVAAVASVATAVLAAEAARVSAEREQVRVAHVDQEIVERLETYGRARPGWSGADGLLRELAISSDRTIVLTDVEGNRLATSGGSDREVAAALDAGDPTAVLDPLADVLAAATASPPSAYDDLSLPASWLATRPAAAELRAALGDYGPPGVCLDDLGEDTTPRGLPASTIMVTACGDLLPSVADTGRGPLAELARLQNAVALEEHRCLARRGVAAVRVRLFAAATAAPALLTTHLPQGRGAPADARAWEDCATAVLTRHLELLVAPRAVLYVSETREVERGLLDRVGGVRILEALALILAVAVLASLVASRRVLRPVRELTAASRDMAAGQLATRVPVRGHDEVARLGRSFNDMAAALKEADEQRRRLVSDVAHELRTPLSNLRGYLEAGRDGVLPRDDGWTESLLEEAVLLEHVVEDLAVLAQADAGRLALRRVEGDVVATVDTALAAMRGYADSRGVGLERSGVPAAPAVHDPIRVRQVVANLLSNAVRHSPEGSLVNVEVGLSPSPGGAPGVLITVADRGEGIAPEHLPHVFERFFRADPSRARSTGGSGLGLSIVEQLVEAHAGTVSAAHRAGGGAVFTAWLPVDPPG